MNGQLFNKVKKEYFEFRKELENNINNFSDVRMLNNKECYLIKENWNNIFFNIITKYEKIQQRNRYSKIPLPKNQPELIHDLSSVKYCIQNNCKLKLVSKNLINLLYNINLNCNNVHYSAGNNKIIIEYKRKEKENDVLLIINPLQDICNQKIYTFTIKNINPDKMKIYKELLNINENDLNLKSYNIIKNIEELNNKKKEDSYNNNKSNRQSSKADNENKVQLFNFNRFLKNNNDTKKLESFFNSKEKYSYKYMNKKDYENSKKRCISQENINNEKRYDIFINNKNNKTNNSNLNIENEQNQNKVSKLSLINSMIYDINNRNEISENLRSYKDKTNLNAEEVKEKEEKNILEEENNIKIKEEDKIKKYINNKNEIPQLNNKSKIFQFSLSQKDKNNSNDEKIKEKNEYINKLKEEKNILEEQINIKNKQENEMKEKYLNEINNIRIQLNDKENELKKIQKLNEQNEEKQEKRIRKLENKIKELENELEERAKQINNMPKEKDKNKDIEQKYNNILITKDNKIKELTEKNQELRQCNYEINEKIKEYEKKLEQINIKLKEKNKIIEELQSTNNELNEKKIIYEKKNKKLKKEMKLEKEKLDKRNFQILEKENNFNKKISFLEDKENLIEKENKKFEQTKIEFQKDIEENIIIKQENKELKNKNKDLKEKIYEKQRKFEELLSNINEINIKKQKLTKNLNRSCIQMPYEDEEMKNTDNKNNRKISLSPRVYNNPIKLYTSPTLIGLDNIGSTCFINSTLQCLSQTELLTNYFLKVTNEYKIINNNIAKKNKNELQLCPYYLKLIQNLWSNNKNQKSFSPKDFMNIVEKMNPLFKKGQAGDSKDFIIFILEQIHKELKAPVNINLNITEPLNQYDRNNAFNHFFSEFQKDCSIISDIFFGINETTNICMNCKNIYNTNGYNNPICYNYGIFNCLIFPLEEVKKLKNISLQQNNCFQINNDRVSIYECFSYNQNNEYFTGQNRNYCNICKQKFDSIYSSKIYVSPNVLILILNRGKGNMYNVKLDFTETIDITQFVLFQDIPQNIYDLYGVITHIGESGPNAHFIASCKSPIDNNWYRYNDSIVNHINNIQKDVIDFGTPYILFYQKRK